MPDLPRHWRVGTFGRRLGSDEVMNVVLVFMKKERVNRRFTFPVTTMWAHNGGEPATGASSAGHLILEFQPPELGTIN